MTSWNLSLLVPSMMIQRHQQSWTCHHHLISVFFPHCVPTASYCQLHGTESSASSSAATSAQPFIFPPRRDVVFPALFLQRAPSSHLPTTYPGMQLNLNFLLIVKYIMTRPPRPTCAVLHVVARGLAQSVANRGLPCCLPSRVWSMSATLTTSLIIQCCRE